MTARSVWMAGPALSAPGGMSAVVCSYRDAGLFDAADVVYLDTYTRPGLRTQLQVFGRAVLRLGRALLGGQVRLLHVHSASRGSFWRKSVLCAMARLAGVPYLFHVHSGEFPLFYEREAGALGRWWVRRTLRHAHAVLALTPGWAARLQALLGEVRCTALPNPVPLPAQAPLPRVLRRRLLFLGRIRQKKGAFDLLRAFALVLQAQPETRLVMAGDGDQAAGEALCAELGITHAVAFTGWIDGAAKAAALQAADIFVLPSYFEGLPIGVLEAMAGGLVVVASPVGGVPDLVTDGVQGRLVPPGEVARLAEALGAVLADPQAGNAMVAAAWQQVQRHDAKLVAQQLQALYDEAAPLPAGAVR